LVKIHNWGQRVDELEDVETRKSKWLSSWIFALEVYTWFVILAAVLKTIAYIGAVVLFFFYLFFYNKEYVQRKNQSLAFT